LTHIKTKPLVVAVACATELPIHRAKEVGGAVGAGGAGNSIADSAFGQAKAFRRRVSGG